MRSEALGQSPVQRYLERLHEDLLGITDGEVASYIPELTNADPAWLGIALVTVDGHVYQVGDSRQPFTIQSISKAISYGLALEDRGLEHVISKIGVEPSGEAFNSISLEPDSGRPLNPMINAGAIATTGLVADQPGAPPMERIMDTFARYAGHALNIDEDVYQSESTTGHRNRAIAHLLYGHEILDRSPEEVVDLYFRQCSILVTARDLAMMGSCLANNGVNPVTGVVALNSRYVEKVLSVMSTCGMYDYSGAWIYDVGMPAKSGVGGGIMAVLPGQFGLGVFSPALDIKGNSVRGIEACKRLSNDFSLHLFNVARSTSTSVVRKVYDGAKFGSRRQRNESDLKELRTRAKRVHIYELQGELLFGNTESVVLGMLSDLPAFDYLVISMRRVIGMDRAAIRLFSELCLRVDEAGKWVFFTDCQHLYRLRKQLQNEEQAQTPGWLDFVDADRAEEWCEDQLLLQISTAREDQPVDLSEQHLCEGMPEDEFRRLESLCQHRRFSAGERVVRNGDEAESMFFILTGELEVVVDAEAQKQLRLKTLGPGTVFGEMALINGQQRSADVIAATDVSCFEVRFDDLDDALRTRILANMAAYFANKIRHDTQLMQHLA